MSSSSARQLAQVRSRWLAWLHRRPCHIDNSGHLWRKPCCCRVQLQLLPLTEVKNGSLSVFHFTFVEISCQIFSHFVASFRQASMFAKGEAAVAPIREWGSCKIGMSDHRAEYYRTKHMSIRRTSISFCMQSQRGSRNLNRLCCWHREGVFSSPLGV